MGDGPLLPLLWESEMGCEQRESECVCVCVRGERENTSLLYKEKRK